MCSSILALILRQPKGFSGADHCIIGVGEGHERPRGRPLVTTFRLRTCQSRLHALGSDVNRIRLHHVQPLATPDDSAIGDKQPLS